MRNFIITVAICCVMTFPARSVETPTMGWSSWNTFAIDINDSLIMRQADAMVSTGLYDAGYRYVNIDDGFFGGRDKSTGQLLIHPTRFPRGLKPVVDYIHSLRLKAGIYSDAGANTCGNYWNNDTIAKGVGLLGHEHQDLNMFFNDLKFDFIKVDYCGASSQGNFDRMGYEPQERYTEISRVIAETGRDDVRMNVCKGYYPGTWVSDVATSWRTTLDIKDSWESVKDIIAENLYLSAYAVNGCYNDMDMLEVGRSMTPEEDRTHFAMWCIMSSPLLIGCDMTKIAPEPLKLLKNKELIALNQDTLGLQAYVVAHQDSTYVLVKDVEVKEGRVRAVAFYNPTDRERAVTIDFTDIDLAGSVRVRDLMDNADIGVMEGALSSLVPAHGTKVYKLTADTRLMRTLYEAETAFLTSYQELYDPNIFYTSTYEPDPSCSGGMKAVNLGLRAANDVQWRSVMVPVDGDYALTFRCITGDDRFFYVSVNDDAGRICKVKPAADGDCMIDVTLTVHMRKGENKVRLYNDRAKMPDIDYMMVR